MDTPKHNPRFARSFRRFGRKVLRTLLVLVVLISQLGPYTYIGAKSASAATSIPKLLNYQARVTDDAGVAVPDGNLNIWISVYDAPSGGSCLYAMRGSCGSPSYKTVTVSSGVFSMLIGDTASGDAEIPDDLFDRNALYLGVTVASDTEMVPRKRISASPYAFNADRLDDLDLASSGSTTPYVVGTTANGNLVITGDPQGGLVSNGSVYVNPASASASETLFGIADNGTNRWMIDKEGDVTHSGSLLATAASSTAQFVFRAAASQSNNVFEVQDANTNRMFSVSATATTVGSTSSTDAVVFNARVGSNLTPTTDATFSLGDYNRRWRDLWISGGSVNVAYDASGTSVMKIGVETASGYRGVIATPDNMPLQLKTTRATSETNGIYIGTSGRVGINTTSVDGVAALDVNGQLAVTAGSASSVALKVRGAVAGYGIYFEGSGTVTSIAAASSQVAQFSTTGFRLNVNGSESAPSLALTSGDSSGLFTPAANVIGFTTNDTERMRIAADGRVGIGNAAPANRLTVGSATSTFEIDGEGNVVKINNVVYSWPSSQGGSSTVLTNDGSGNLSWGAGGGSTTLQGAYDNDADGGDVTITTNATDGHIIIAGSQELRHTSTGDVRFDGSTFVVDTSSDRVGIGESVPDTNFHVVGSATGADSFLNASLKLENTSSGESAILQQNSLTGSNMWFTGLNESTNYSIAYGTSYIDDNYHFRLNPDGNAYFGDVSSTVDRIVNVIGLKDAAIVLSADTNDTTEDDNAYVTFSQDNASVKTVVGLTGNAGFDSENVAYTSALANAFLVGGKNASSQFQVGTNNIVRMTIDSSGDVGFGTNAPGQDIEISKTGSAVIRVSGDTDNVTETDVAQIQLNQDGGVSTAYWGMDGNTANDMVFAVNSTTNPDIRFETASSGTSYGGTARFTIYNAGDGSFGDTMTQDGQFVIRQDDAADIFNLYDGASNVLTVRDGGNVGIGNLAPANRLTVGSATSTFEIDGAGNVVKINNVVYSWPSAQGAASSVLQNNGSGTLSWASASGLVNLNQAYLNSTSTNELYVTPSLGALTIADTVGGLSNIFEIQNRVNAAGDYNARLFTVSSTSTIIGIDPDGTALNGARVGVGTSTPNARLHVNNNGESLLNISNESATVSPVWSVSVGSGGTHADGMFVIGPGTGAGLLSDKALSLTSGGAVYIGNSTTAILQSTASTLSLRANSTTASNLFQITTNNQGNLNGTGNQNIFNIGLTYAPTSGSGEFRSLLLAPTINQTGSAVGDYSILKIAPTITASTGTNKYLIEAGTAASESLFVLTEAGRVGIGNAAPSHLLTVGSGTSTLEVDTSGNLVKIRNVAYSWPSSQGGASTVLTNDGSGVLTWSAASTGGTLQTAYDSSTGTTEIFLGSARGALTIADSFSSFGGNLFEIQDRTNSAGDYSRRYFTVSSTGTRIDGSGTVDLTINASNDTGLTISRGNSTKWRLRNDFGGAGATDAFVLSEGIATPRLSIMPTVGWVGINTDAPNAPLEVRPTSDTVIQNVFSVTNASNSARYLTVSSTAVESMPDTDFAATFGRFTLRNHSTDIVHLGHYDWNSSTTVFGLRFDQDGDVYLRANSASPDLNFQSGTSGNSRITWMLNGTQRMQMDSSGRLNVGGSAVTPYAALSVRDPLAEPTSNIFEVANSLSTAPYLTVSSTSTNLAYAPTVNSGLSAMTLDATGILAGSAMRINAPNIQTGAGLFIDAATSTLTGTGSALKVVGPSTCCTGANSNGMVADFRMSGNPTGNNSAAMVWMAASGLTTGKVLNVSGSDVMTSGTLVHVNTRAGTLTSGSLLSVTKTSTSAASVTYTGNVAEVSYEQIFSGGGVNTGRTFDVSRNLTINGAAASPVIAGAVARFSDNLTLTTGWVRHGANVVSIAQDFVGATNTALSVVSSATGGGGAYVAGKFEPLVVAGYMPSPTSTLFAVQNTSQADGISYTNRYFTVSATSVNFTCAGCGSIDRAMTVTADSTAVMRLASGGSNPASFQLHRNESGNNWNILVDTVTAEALQFRFNSTERLRYTTNGLMTQTIGTLGTIQDIVLGTSWTSGTVLNADFTSATTLVGDLIGANLNFHDFATGAAGKSVTGMRVFTPSLTQTSATTTDYIGLIVNGQSGGLTQNTAAGTINWRGADIIMPSTLTETTGTVDAKGIVVRAVSSTGGGDRMGLHVSLPAGGGGAHTGVYLQKTGAGGANERGLVFSTNWDTEIDFESTTPKINVADGATLTIRESGGNNTLMTIVDAGSTGNVTVTGNLTVNGTCTGCGGGTTTLGGAYGASTGTAEIYLDSTRGALTIADSFSSFGGNLFEIQDRTNVGGAYSQRYLTVSSTSTTLTHAEPPGGDWMFRINDDGTASDSTPAIYVDDAGRVGFGTTTGSGARVQITEDVESTALSVISNVASADPVVAISSNSTFTNMMTLSTAQNGSGTFLNILSQGATATSKAIDIDFDNGNNDHVVFRLTTDETSISGTAADTVKFRINGSGSVQGDGNLTFGSASGTNVIDFSGARIGSNLTPTTDDTYSLGDYNRRWKNLWLTGGSAHIAHDTSGTSVMKIGIETSNGYRGVIATPDNMPLHLRTSRSESSTGGIYIDASGNVGIGTTSPTSALDIRSKVPTTHVGSVQISTTNTSTRQVEIQGDYAYVLQCSGTTNCTLHVVDITIPTAPRLVSTTQVDRYSEPFAVHGDYGYIQRDPPSGRTLAVYDLSDPASVVESGTATSTGSNFDTSAIAVSGRYVYTSGTFLNVYDVGTPTAPVLVGSASIGAGSAGGDIKIRGDWLYGIASGGSQVTIYRISSPTNPVQVSTMSTSSTPLGLDFKGNYAYIANFTGNNLNIYDVSNPDVPLNVAAFSFSGIGSGPSDVTVHGERAYVKLSSSQKVIVLDVSNPIVPKYLGEFTGNSISDPEIQGRYMYMVNNAVSDSTFRVYDIGGAFIQNLESGTFKADDVRVAKGLYADDAWFRSGLHVSGSTLVDGFMSIQAATGTSIGTSLLNVGANQFSGGTFSGNLINLTMDGPNDNNFTGNGIRILVDETRVSSAARAFLLEDAAGNDLFAINDAGAVSMINTFSSGNAFSITANSMQTSNVLAITANALTSGHGISVTSSSALSSTGNLLRLTATSQTTGNLLVLTGGGANLASGGEVAEIDMGAATTGSGLRITSSGAYAGDGSSGFLELESSATGITGPLLYVGTQTTGTAANGHIRFLASGTRAGGNFFQVNDFTQVGTAVQFSASSITTGTVLSLNAGSGGNATAIRVNNGTDQFTVSATGTVRLNLPLSTGNWAVCHRENNGASTMQTLVDCANTPAADYMEMYPAASGLFPGHIVTMGETAVVAGGVEVPQVVKTETAYESGLIGVISDPSEAGDFNSIGHNVPAEANPMPVALKGRVRVRVNTENGAISKGDPITSSSVPGVGMKATRPGMIVGQALESWNGSGEGMVLVFIGTAFHSGLAITTDGATSLFGDDFAFGATGTATEAASSTPFSSFALSFRGSAWDSASNTAVTRNIKMLNEVEDAANYQLAFRNHGNDLLASLDQAGNLAIAGTLSVEGGFDYAEMFPAVPDLDAGDIVMVDPDNATGYGVKKTESAYENSAIGVISTKPGFLTGDRKAEDAQPVALAGRVPVKVNLEGGEIRPGDPIASSSERGVGMRATEAGRVVGIALEGWSGSGTGVVTMFVNPSWWNGPMPVGEASAGSGLTIAQDSLLDFKNSVLSNVAAVISTNGSWGVTSDGHLVARKLEAQDVAAETFTVKASAEAPERTVGVGRIQAGYDAVLVPNAKVKPDSLIVVTFEGNPGANWWIDEKLDGHFVLKLAQGAHMDLKFTYWIVPIEGALDPAPDGDGSATGTEETSPPPGSGTGSGTGTPETGGETGSGSGTEETS